MQLSLLSEHHDIQVPQIQGLHYYPDFISVQIEQKLITTIDQQPWLPDLKRRVQHYGWRYDYKARTVTDDLYIGALPDWLRSIAKQMYEAGIFTVMPDQVIINEYQPGQGIAAHIDCQPCFGETIASLSLGSNCVMELSNHSKKLPIMLEPLSLLTLTDDARYLWKHAIASRKSDQWNGVKIMRERRISLTFRTVIRHR
ncbi:MAG: alpha-ketoglutarate-dependent dioxygenase AlkB [Sphaerospermopsis sp. SIO1G2]|nr:alpha-ketoglutarate-dependent dioxygenase AlkB [Sphaerospermopsis sp. SIO1G2]